MCGAVAQGPGEQPYEEHPEEEYHERDGATGVGADETVVLSVTDGINFGRSQLNGSLTS